MAISYTWDVNTVDVYPTHNEQSNVIYRVHWKLKATDTETYAEEYFNQETQEIEEQQVPYKSSVYGKEILDISDLSSFTDFDNVTSSQVQGWLESSLGSDKVQSIKDQLDAKISEQKTPTSVTKQLS